MTLINLFITEYQFKTEYFFEHYIVHRPNKQIRSHGVISTRRYTEGKIERYSIKKRLRKQIVF